MDGVVETHEAGARVRNVAARRGLCESLVFTWRRQVREGVLVAPEVPASCRCGYSSRRCRP